MKSVTVPLGRADYFNIKKPLFVKGDFIKVAGTKRIYLKVTEVDNRQDGETLTVRKGYKASPRSRLKYGKTPFSKIGIRIINPFPKKNNP